MKNNCCIIFSAPGINIIINTIIIIIIIIITIIILSADDDNASGRFFNWIYRENVYAAS